MYLTRPPISSAAQARRRASALKEAAQTLDAIRARHQQVGPDHAMHHRADIRSAIFHALILPIFFCALLVWRHPQVLDFWQSCVNFWFLRLALPLHATVQDASSSMVFVLTRGDTAMYLPDTNLKAATLVVLSALFAASFLRGNAMLPLKYLVRLLCTVHFIALLFFWLVPLQFPYTLGAHLAEVVQIGYLLLLAIPVMLAIGYYLLPARLVDKLLHTIIILAYFILVIPHKVVLHALILHHGSLLTMPLLYVCFGTVFDILLFIALYSWAVSRLPHGAT